MVSLKDIAEACGVSVATVSKALNNQSDISEARRSQIRRKADEMGYLPNMAARALKTKATHDIGVLFADDHQSGLTHPFFSEVLEGLRVRAESQGYDITFINMKLQDRKATYLEHCRYRNVDGVVIACVDFSQPEVLELVNSSIPVVTIDHVFDRCATISSNNLRGIQELVRYAVTLGHERIAYIHGKSSSVTDDRLAGFFGTMEEFGLTVPEEYLEEIDYLDDEAAAEVTRKILGLRRRPTCILYPDDYTCIGGMNVIRSAGLSVPEDISVAGYDGVTVGRLISPKLTTYSQNMRGLGEAAASKIIELIEKPRTTLKDNTVLEGQLVKGETVIAVR
jgi:DNA-binding LacI/PurR family transcriptional regulator